MPVSTPCRQHRNHLPDWQLMDAAIAGERAIKNAGTDYLPKTSGMLEAEVLDPVQAQAIYRGYKARAEYPQWVTDSLRSMLGMVGKLTPEVSLPPELKGLEDNATTDGFGLSQLFVRVCRQLLVKGRAPLLADFDEQGNPRIALYTAENLINWRSQGQDLTLAVLQEQAEIDTGDEFAPDTEVRFRVLDLVEGAYRVRLMDRHGELLDVDFPGLEGGSERRPLDFVPLVAAGATDNSLDVDEIPLLSMAQAALQYYRLSADYRQSLHFTAHPQPVITGLDEDSDLRVTGPMAAWTLPEDANAFFMEAKCAGIDATRQAMIDQRNAALEAGARVMDVGNQRESGDARRARQDDQRATLATVVTQAAEAIEQAIHYLALWSQARGEVTFKVEPEFTKTEVDSAMLKIASDMVLAGEAPRSVLYQGFRLAGLTDQSDEELEMQREGGDA